MIRSILCAAFGLVSVLTAPAATLPIYINSSPVNGPAPQIDATIFVNQSIFNITPSSGLPYSTFNTLFFTNRLGSSMYSPTGFRFDFFTNNFRYWMNTWANFGTITGVSVILVSSTNIINSGSLHSASDGLIRLSGRNVDLNRGRIRTGQSDAIPLFGGDTFGTNYSSAPGVTDLYWGVGTNNHVDNNGVAMNLTAAGFTDLSYIPPFLQSPFHQVIDTTFLTPFTNLVSVGGFNYGAFVHRAQTGPTNFIVQVVFAPTNNFDPNFTTEVRFYTNFGNGVAIPIVQFRSVDLDIVTLRQNTNAVYLVDNAALSTNLFLARPQLGGTSRRPGNYELFRTAPFEFQFAGPYSGNTPYSPDLIYNPTYQFSRITNTYSGYAASVGSVAFTNGIIGGGVVEPTNLTGRIEISGDSLNLDQARIRAESTAIIRTRDLADNRVAQVDAQYLLYDLASSEPQMTISNLAPSSVRRFSGQIAAWTGEWVNYENTATATNEIDFHVLIVDNFLNSVASVVMNEFKASAAHLEINDVLNVRKTFQLEAAELNITGGLTLPFGANWAHTNVIGVFYFTNSGSINIPGSAFFCDVPADPYINFVNSGSIAAATMVVSANEFQNSGSLYANGGQMSVQADRAVLQGRPTILFTNLVTNFFGQVFGQVITNSIGPKLAAEADLIFQARRAGLSNAIFQARSGISISVSEYLVDSGQGALNFWLTSGGLQMNTLPAVSDLLATHVTSVAAASEEVSHTWPAADFGATVRGFQNNLALGKLTLDGGEMSLFRFASAGGQRALYVDYLELLNYATNYSSMLAIEPNLTIYFANSSIAPGKLDGRLGGRLRWVRNFTGPLSSTNITYPSGQTYTFNIGLVQDKDLDSDGDNTVNGEDPTPIYAAESVDLQVALTNAPTKRAVISWHAVVNATSYVEYKTSLSSPVWNTLAGPLTATSTQRQTFNDPIPGGMQQRFYRVRVIPPPL